jgi:Asp-tRNA(Asn)/Glu-tRNA(Gln) amidotransferase A subunit family amidase
LSPGLAVRRLLACAALVLGFLVLGPGSAKAAPVLDLATLDGRTAVAMMDAGELTSVELTQAYIDRIVAMNQQGPGLNAVSQFNKDALVEAQKTDELRAEGKVLSPAMGLPILLKDLIDIKGMYTSAGNFSLRDSYPATDSGVAKKLRDNGVVILGKLGLSEFAHYFADEPSGFSNLTGQVINANDADQNPGGSSSGSGSSAAAAFSSLTIGTSTGGSISSPARVASLVGLTPTLGLVPGYGIAPIAASQDTAGPMERSVADAALNLTVTAGPDPLNDYSGIWGPGVDDDYIVPPLPNPIPNYLSALDLDYVKGKRIGYTDTSAVTLEAKQVLEDAGAILALRPNIVAGTTPPSVFAYEAKRDVTRYYERLGPDAPIKSIHEEVLANEAEAHEALKFGHSLHLLADSIDLDPNSADSIAYRENLVKGKEITRAGLDRMLANDTADPSDDFIALLGAPPNPTRPGYPWLSLPMGYDASRRSQFTYVEGPPYMERDLIGIGYVIEQGMLAKGAFPRKPVDQINPSMYRCTKTVPLPAFAERGDCNPDYTSTLAMAGGSVPELPFPLETESAQGLAARMSAGTLSAADLTKAYLARIAVANSAGPAIQAVREVNPSALAEATALDAERESKGPRGPLHGIPVLLDDGIDAVGLPSSGGSIALQGATPNQSSRIVTKLKQAGAIVLGKANVSELNGLFSATMPEGYSSLGGQVLLPSDTDKNPAGSSAGSATATAAGMAAMAVGMETSTDTAQMIMPAANAGVVALKPTVGRVSRSGVMPIARSQDSPGPIAQTVHDAAAQLQAIAGADFKDPATEAAPPVPDYLGALSTTALVGKTVAIVDNSTALAATKAPYDQAVAKFAALGATTVTTTIGAAAPNPIATREFERDLDTYLGGLSGGNAGSLAEIVEYNADNPVEGLKYTQGQLLEAAAVNLGDPTQKAAYETDLATGKAADKATIDAILSNGTAGDNSDDIDVIAVPQGSPLVGIADRAGYPVLTVPAGFGAEASTSGRNPVGIVFVAAAYAEQELLADGYAFEQASPVRLTGPDYDSLTPGIQPLVGGSGAPSWTNPSMWRCVELSAFYSPHHCRPGMVEPLTTTPVTPGNPDPEPPKAPEAPGPTGPSAPSAPAAGGSPKLTLTVTPKARSVGAKREQVSFLLTAKNVGNAGSGPVSICTAVSKQRLKPLGKKCIEVELGPGASRERTVQLKIKPAAVGKATTITFRANGAAVDKSEATASLTVREG